MFDDPIAILAVRRLDEPQQVVRPHLWPLIIIVLTLMAVAVGFFGAQGATNAAIVPTDSATPTAISRVYVVSYRFNSFSPTNLRIHAGDTVRFRNDGLIPIRIVADLQQGDRVPQFDSVGLIQPDSYFSYTFPVTGIFGYHNASNNNETGLIIVR